MAPGDYEIGSDDSPVAVAIIGRGVAPIHRDRFSLKGTLKTENIGIEKLVVNIISNPRIRFLVACGKDEFGHFPGDALVSLIRNGVDERMRIVGTRAAIPYLCNLPREAVDRFRRQVEVIDLVHPKEVAEIVGYDQEYEFDGERRAELLLAVEGCEGRDPGTFPEEPLLVEVPALMTEGGMIGKSLNIASDKFASHMLRMPSERLSTSASLAVVSEEFGFILDPVDDEIVHVPSVHLAARIKSYLSGGA
ncbi:MAG: hypothetical protein FJ151_04890 [Euryarchaeota archaeon]|nr:hypothetical protein [Euryarchaeota archaeon]